MKRFYTSLFLVTSVAVTLAGCDKLPFNQKADNFQGQQEVLTPIQGEVLAQVNNWRIGTEDFQARLDILKQNPQYAEADLDSIENKKAILQELIRLVALSQEAKNRGFAEEEDVKQALADFERTLLVQKLVEDVSKDTLVTDLDVDNFYNNPENSAMFTQPGSLRVREIVVASETEANNVLKRLLDGEGFVSIAQQVSISETKSQGGDLGSVIPVPDQEGGITAVRIEEGKDPVEVKRFSAFWQTVASMTADTDARKIKGDDGKYYVLKVTEIVQPAKIELTAEIKENLKQGLMVEKQTEVLERLATEAKQKANLVINEDLL